MPGLRAGLTALWCGLALALPAAAQDGPRTVTPDELRAIASQLLVTGEAARAAELATGLLNRDEDDYVARAIRAQAQAELGRLPAARRDLRLAFADAPEGREKARIALQAARYAYTAGHWTTAQIWLRRAAIHAPDQEFLDNLARDYAQVRAVNPFNVRLRFAVTPSDNVNNGADSEFLTIDGLPTVGTLSSDAQALSGQIITTQVALRYAFQRSARARSDVGLTYFRRDVRLSQSARRKAPDAKSEDFESAITQIDLSHARQFPLGDERLLAIGRLTYADAQVGDDGTDDFDEYGIAGRLQRLTGAGYAPYLTFSLEERRYDATSFSDSEEWMLGIGVTRELGNGHAIDLSLDYAERDSDNPNNTETETRFTATYGMVGTFDWVDLSASLTLSRRDFDTYVLGGEALPDGREDDSALLVLRGVLSSLSYAGFAPVASLTVGRRSSNISRFDIEETSLGLEIVSSF